MLFNSLFFLFIFFPIVTGVYYFLPHRARTSWLLVASCYFYMSLIPAYILILGLTITIDYFSGLLIEGSKEKLKRLFLFASIVSNIGVLFLFKYFNFFNANIAALAEQLHWNYSVEALALALPIGLSFHTFQGLAYIIEVYRGRQKAERSYGIFALYVMFYPQLVAGPIERPQRLLHQFHERHPFNLDRFFSGVRLILWGLFKKVVIADRVSVFVNQIFNNANDYTGAHLALATVLFAFQIYCDFSGYSDMARGLARTLGYELMINFSAPYLAVSVSDFWRRWHISLSTWFRDYVYHPLGGNRGTAGRVSAHLLLTFLLSGLWHGANWTFVVWGALNGLYLVCSRWTETARRNVRMKLGLENFFFWRIVQVVFVFVLICVSWIFFRAQSLPQSWIILSKIVTEGAAIHTLLPFVRQYAPSLAIAGGSIVFLVIVDIVLTQEHLKERLARLPAFFHVTACFLLIACIALLGRFTNEQFIYFQF